MVRTSRAAARCGINNLLPERITAERTAKHLKPERNRTMGTEQRQNGNRNEIEHVEVTPVEQNALEIMERASIDVQIATAHTYTRQKNGGLKAFISRATDMVTVDKETAEACIYRRPVGKDESGRMQYHEGESIRLAEIVAACYGNLRVQGMITEVQPRQVKAVGVAHDLESNYAAKAEVIEATIKKNGQPFDERMRLNVAKSAQSKAIRDAIFRVVPKSLCKSIIENAYQVIRGKEEPLTVRRARVGEWLKKLSIDATRVYTALGVNGLEEIGQEELEALTGIRTALKDGDVTIDEAFPPIETPDKTPQKGVASAKAKIKGKAEAKKQQEAEQDDPDQLEPEVAEPTEPYESEDGEN